MSINLHPQYVTNTKGERVSVILPIEEFNTLIEKTDSNFQENKLYFQESLENIENGKTTIISHKNVWESIDNHTREL
jgi:hypothetical protein